MYYIPVDVKHVGENLVTPSVKLSEQNIAFAKWITWVVGYMAYIPKVVVSCWLLLSVYAWRFASNILDSNCQIWEIKTWLFPETRNN